MITCPNHALNWPLYTCKADSMTKQMMWLQCHFWNILPEWRIVWVNVTSGSCATWPGNTELGRNWKTKGFWTSASARALCLPSIIVQLFEAWKKSEKYKVNCFRKAEWSGKVPRKIPRVSNRSKKLRASIRGRKCQGSVPGCQRFPEVLKNVSMLRNGAGRLRRFGRAWSLETRKMQESYKEEFCQVEGARCSQYLNCRMYMKEASFIL